MKPIEQKVVGENGDCLSACIASILEREDVPHYLDEHWFLNYWDWLKEKGYSLHSRSKRYKPKGFYILVLNSRINPEWLHAVVANGNEIIWDPSPFKYSEKPLGERKYILELTKKLD
ncbi:MAG: hypothetical protein AABY07_01165 [Nanoarchaeota archaeon]